MKAATKRERFEEEDRVIRAPEAAHLLGVKISTVYQWKYLGRLTAVKLFDGVLGFRLSEIRRLIARFERPALRQTPMSSNASGRRRVAYQQVQDHATLPRTDQERNISDQQLSLFEKSEK